MPHITHQEGTKSELVVSEHLVSLGFYVFSPVVYQQGPIDVVAINEEGDVFLIDVKTDGKRTNPKRKKPARIYRVRTELQKKLDVVPPLYPEDLTEEED